MMLSGKSHRVTASDFDLARGGGGGGGHGPQLHRGVVAGGRWRHLVDLAYGARCWGTGCCDEPDLRRTGVTGEPHVDGLEEAVVARDVLHVGVLYVRVGRRVVGRSVGRQLLVGVSEAPAEAASQPVSETEGDEKGDDNKDGGDADVESRGGGVDGVGVEVEDLGPLVDDLVVRCGPRGRRRWRWRARLMPAHPEVLAARCGGGVDESTEDRLLLHSLVYRVLCLQRQRGHLGFPLRRLVLRLRVIGSCSSPPIVARVAKSGDSAPTDLLCLLRS